MMFARNCAMPVLNPDKSSELVARLAEFIGSNLCRDLFENGYQPTIDIAEGLDRFVEWYRNFYR